ncbi:MAG TPA: cysteine peptidase family C39 domain-containing protein [Saprospiraceae bacterium]|nr:cysteine peptidase family C39 domain-containing protein [Saprospiraceae bacterium]
MPKSFPFSEQQSEMDCGAACLRMVARFYERYYSLAELKELTNFSRDGVSLLDISQASEKIGFRTSPPGLLLNNWWKMCRCPAWFTGKATILSWFLKQRKKKSRLAILPSAFWNWKKVNF